ncbi:MAG: hypothetical protein ABI627_19795 [Polyangiaceae bacterium]
MQLIQRAPVVLIAALFLAATCRTSPVFATEPSQTTAPRAPSAFAPKLVDTSAAMLVGYGFNEFGHSAGAPNPFNVGFGAAFGLTFWDAAYLGANIVYYVGQSGSNAINTETGQKGSFRMSTLTATLDLGYRLRLGGDIMLRPYLAVGLLDGFASIPGASETTHRLYVAPSLALQIPLRRNAFVGAELRYGLGFASGDTHSNISAFAAVGYRF